MRIFEYAHHIYAHFNGMVCPAADQADAFSLHMIFVGGGVLDNRGRLAAKGAGVIVISAVALHGSPPV